MSTPQPARVQLRGPASVIAAVPYLLGFHPQTSFVLIAMTGSHGRVTLAFRFDLPDPPSTEVAAAAADHAVSVLRQVQATAAIGIGYGPGTLVTPIADAMRVVLPRQGIRLHDILRVDEDRYWSYLCSDPACCPAEGAPVPASDHPAARTLAAAGITAKASRAAVAESIAPVTGSAAEAMTQATRQVEIAVASEPGREANLALDRAFADDPGYSMAKLLRQALDAGLPSSAARLPMSPEEVAASYDAQRRP